MITYLIFLFIEIKINPTKVINPPKNILNVIISENIKYANIVAIIGSPSGKAAAIVGETYFIE